MLKYFANTWRGEVPSWKVFWISGVAILLGMNLAIYSDLSKEFREYGYINPGKIVGHSIFFGLYLSWLTVSLWRSSKNSIGGFRILARLGAALFALIAFACFYLFAGALSKI
jgi:hypothetical protein